ncbi:MAG: hypothetical protein ACTSUN_02990, partial [Promethearchaeota archaeon]
MQKILWKYILNKRSYYGAFKPRHLFWFPSLWKKPGKKIGRTVNELKPSQLKKSLGRRTLVSL